MNAAGRGRGVGRSARDPGLWRGEGGRVRWGWRLLMFLALLAGLWVATAQLSAWLEAPWMTGAWAREWGVVVVLAALLLASWTMMEGVEGVTMAALGTPLDGRTLPALGRGFLLGGALMAGVVAAMAAAGWLAWETEPGLARLPAWGLRMTLFFAAAAFAEELLARGYPFQVIAEGWGGPAAILVTSAAFALLHLWNPGGDALLPMINLGLAGVLLGVAYWKTYDLWYATGVHLGWNWVMAVGADLPVSGLAGASFDTPGYEVVVRGPALWTGGAFGPEGGLLVTAATLAGVGWLLASGRVSRSLRILALRPIPERGRGVPGARPGDRTAGGGATRGEAVSD